MDDIDKAVQRVIRKAIMMISQAPSNPAFPTTHPSLRYMITPSMVRSVGVNTPPNVPNFFIPIFKSEPSSLYSTFLAIPYDLIPVSR
jgi:hypothetical protein